MSDGKSVEKLRKCSLRTYLFSSGLIEQFGLKIFLAVSVGRDSAHNVKGRYLFRERSVCLITLTKRHHAIPTTNA